MQERTGEVFLRCPLLRLLGEQDQRPPAYHQAAHLAPLQTTHSVHLLQEQLEETFYRKAKRFPSTTDLTKFFILLNNFNNSNIILVPIGYYKAREFVYLSIVL